MKTDADDNPAPNAAAEYRLTHRNRLMVLTRLKSETPTLEEFCRIRSVETVSPGLWITALFLDDTTRRFRPDKIRVATADEETLSNELMQRLQSGISQGLTRAFQI
jgi:hypothetical protein